VVNKCRCGGHLYTKEYWHDSVIYDVRKCHACGYWSTDLVATPNPVQVSDKSVNRRAGKQKSRR